MDLGPGGAGARGDPAGRAQEALTPGEQPANKGGAMKLKNPIKDMRTIKALLLGAEDQARAAGESQPGAEHLLLSALELPEGSGRRAFERAGADPDELRPAIERQHADALRAIGIESPIDDTHAADRPE